MKFGWKIDLLRLHYIFEVSLFHLDTSSTLNLRFNVPYFYSNSFIECLKFLFSLCISLSSFWLYNSCDFIFEKFSFRFCSSKWISSMWCFANFRTSVGSSASHLDPIISLISNARKAIYYENPGTWVLSPASALLAAFRSLVRS